jgi:hypothetical protein
MLGGRRVVLGERGGAAAAAAAEPVTALPGEMIVAVVSSSPSKRVVPPDTAGGGGWIGVGVGVAVFSNSVLAQSSMEGEARPEDLTPPTTTDAVVVSSDLSKERLATSSSSSSSPPLDIVVAPIGWSSLSLVEPEEEGGVGPLCQILSNFEFEPATAPSCSTNALPLVLIPSPLGPSPRLAEATAPARALSGGQDSRSRLVMVLRSSRGVDKIVDWSSAFPNFVSWWW